jgi:hypothetical protein
VPEAHDNRRPSEYQRSSVASPAEELGLIATSVVMRAHATTREIAKKDPATFCSYVLRDELTHKPIELAPMHEQMHDEVTAHKRVVMWAHFESGKTTQLSIGRVLFELALNPNLRIAVVSRAAKGAKKIIRSIKSYIEKSEELHELFPGLKRHADPTAPWSSEALTVQRDTLGKDPSVQACGLHGQIVGSRIDILILDDILDFEVTNTADRRDDVKRWVESSLFTRLTAEAMVIIVGNAWHEDDLMHKCVEEKGYRAVRFPIYVGGEGANDNGEAWVNGRRRKRPREISWTGNWTEPRIEQTRRDLGVLEFARKMLCIARNDDMQRFKLAWVHVAYKAGVGFELVHSIEPIPGRVERVPNGYQVITGVDLSTGESNDWSTFVTVLRHPNGNRQLLNVEAHKILGPEIVDKIDEIHQRYGGIIIVENNGSQRFILQFSKVLSEAVCWPYTTGKNKADPIMGVEGIAVELQRGQWIIPCESVPHNEGKAKFIVDPEVDALVREMLFFDPKKHTGDRLMGLFFAREGCCTFDRLAKRGQERPGGTMTVIGAADPVPPPSDSGMQAAVGAN